MDRVQRVHAGAHLRLAGRAVTYNQKAGGSASIVAAPGNSRRDQAAENGLLNVVKADDVHIRTSDFEAAFGLGVRPAEGDTILVDGRVYRVRPLANEPEWRYADQHRHMLRIHMKDEGAVP